MDPKSKTALELDDIGRILVALLRLPQGSDPSAVVDAYVDSRRRCFKQAIQKYKLIEIDKLSDLVFVPGDHVLVGGGGVVFECRNHKVREVKYALKFSRPSLLATGPARALEAYNAARQEYVKHAALSHENIARLFGAGRVPDVPVEGQRPETAEPILMEWVEDALPLAIHLVQRAKDAADVVQVLTQCFEAMSHLHDSELIHWDIKSENFLVNGAGAVKLTDIGSARSLHDPMRGLVAYSTRGNYPPSLPEPADAGSGVTTRRVPLTLPDLSWDTDWVDLWMLAWDLNRLFGACDDVAGRHLKPVFSLEDLTKTRIRFANKLFPVTNEDARFVWVALRLVLERLVSPQTLESEKYYDKARQVVADLRKILPEFGAAQPVPELQAIPQHVLRLPVSGNVPFTGRVAALYNDPALQRLKAHRQLATVSDVYPGAVHRRVEHVAGVFATVCEYVRALFADRSDAFWRLQVDRFDVEALLVAAMFHDVGHVAFGHFLEEMTALIGGRTHEAFAVALFDPERAPEEWPGWTDDSPLATWLASHRKTLVSIIRDQWCASGRSGEEFCRYVAAILRPPSEASPIKDPRAVLSRAKSERLKLEILHSIIDSAIDADKLDYLLRDALHAGVRYTNGIDVDRFLQSLTTVTRAGAAQGGETGPLFACVGVASKGQLPVESILIGRYQMFSSVYWQHTTRAETAMLQYAVQEFVGLGRSQADAVKQLEQLLHVWREADDGEALAWLQGQLGRASKRLGKTRFEVLQGIMTGLLGDRERLYWPAFELRYEGSGQGAEVASRIATAWLGIAGNLAEPRAALDYLGMLRALRRKLSRKLATRLGGRARFRPGELLVDIPPAGRDQIENVFVVRGGNAKAIQSVTPLAEAVHQAFMLWVRAVRIFLAPMAWRRLGTAQHRVSSCCWEVMKELADEQLELFPGGT